MDVDFSGVAQLERSMQSNDALKRDLAVLKTADPQTVPACRIGEFPTLLVGGVCDLEIPHGEDPTPPRKIQFPDLE